MVKVQAVSKKANVSVVYNSVIFLVISFIMTGTYINGFISPFNAVLAGSLSPVCSTAVLTGNLIFCFFTGNLIDSLSMTGAITIIVVSRWIFDNVNPAFKAMTSCICMLSSSLLVMFLIPSEESSELIVSICMSILTGISVYFLSDILDSDTAKIQISGTKGCSYAVICILIITSLTSIDFIYFNIGRIAGVFLILNAARHYKQYGGAVCGVFATCGTMLCSAKMGAGTIFFASAGFVTGFFYEFNRIVFGMFFISVNILGFMLTGFTENSAEMLCDVIAGTILFWIIPDKCLKEYMPDDDRGDEIPLQFTAYGINTAVNTLAEIRKDSQSIAKMLDRNAGNSSKTNIKSAVFKARQYVLFEQMKIAEDILSSVCMNVTENMKYDSRITEKVQLCINERKIRCNSVIAYRNISGRICIDIHSDNVISDRNCEVICSDLSDMLSKEFEYSEKITSDNEYVISFSEKSEYMVECFSSQYGAYENEQSGDTAVRFDDGFGNTYLVISDGMGSGNYAAVDSRMTVSLFRRLVTGGIDAVTAISMINSIMISKSENESFATLDVSKINLDTGELTIIKSGASATLIKHNDSVMMVSGSSFPIGIISDTKPFVKKFSFSDGDTIVMLSDGVSEKSYQYIKTLMLEKDAELSSISKRICKNAGNLFNGRRDDITVLAAKVL